MAMRRGPFARKDFAQARIVLSAPRGARQRMTALAIVAIAFAAGAAVSHFYDPLRLVLPTAPMAESAQPQLLALHQSVEQLQLQSRVAEARGHELERQIDALNQQLRAAQEELTFFHKARDSKR